MNRQRLEDVLAGQPGRRVRLGEVLGVPHGPLGHGGQPVLGNGGRVPSPAAVLGPLPRAGVQEVLVRPPVGPVRRVVDLHERLSPVGTDLDLGRRREVQLARAPSLGSAGHDGG